MLCPFLKNCTEYKNVKQYISAEQFRCHHKENWSKCAIFKKKKEEVEHENP